jgi:hypothetical protein
MDAERLNEAYVWYLANEGAGSYYPKGNKDGWV